MWNCKAKLIKLSIRLEFNGLSNGYIRLKMPRSDSAGLTSTPYSVGLIVSGFTRIV
jgi:hypothetical protein